MNSYHFFLFKELKKRFPWKCTWHQIHEIYIVRYIKWILQLWFSLANLLWSVLTTESKLENLRNKRVKNEIIHDKNDNKPWTHSREEYRISGPNFMNHQYLPKNENINSSLAKIKNIKSPYSYFAKRYYSSDWYMVKVKC